MPDTGLLCVKGLTGSLTKANPIRLFVCILQGEQARLNVRYWIERSRAARDGLKDPLGGGMHPVRKLKRTQIFLASTLEPQGKDCHQRGGERLNCLSNQVRLCVRQPGGGTQRRSSPVPRRCRASFGQGLIRAGAEASVRVGV